ncbi:hypothetical protein KOR34_00150 [Posidoniimonas corsicana]|uniref:Uncharacterized protein n=1 Tax=Posidoniimonas corsicana TaxID=1938618 RepID=A0A5C5V998_9BACT|nr:hypothetical protein [Posidoniimonas corsicana]TWT35128.1 hypothetical protein KOR34_00150 [Posidoniimonas corsicana]
MNGNQIDLSSEAPKPPEQSAKGRFLGIQFDCCGVYARVYPNRAGDAYEGRCPRCLKPIRLAIGPGGSDSRFFTAS